MLDADIEMIEQLDETIADFETHVLKHAKVHDPARLVACAKESAGKKQASSGRKISNAHLKWALSEAAALMIRSSPKAKAFMEKMTRQRGKARAVALVAAKIARVASWILKRKQPFDARQFWKNSLPKGMPTVAGAAMTP